MAETYEQIIEEIENVKTPNDVWAYYKRHEIVRDDSGNATPSVALDVAHRVQDAVAGNPREWYVEDAEGERVYIGDVVDAAGEISKVIGFYSDGFVVENSDAELSRVHRKRATKIDPKNDPQARKKLINEYAKKIYFNGYVTLQNTKQIVSELVDQAIELGAAQ